MSLSETELLKQQIENLKKQIVEIEKRKVVEVINPAQTIDNPMSNAILYIINKFSDDLGPIEKFYRKLWSFGNYAIVCGIGGTLVNYLILSTLVGILPLIIADVLAILVAAFWNYSLTVGALGYLTGLAPKRRNRGDWL
jgi:hypothetical protein